MEFLIISGMSGAGKTRAAAILEDLGYYCVDNMPVELIPKFAEICVASHYEKVAIVMDIRTSKAFEKLFISLEEAEEKGYEFKIIYLDAKDSTLVSRYKETRRAHPMSRGGVSLAEAIKGERNLLEPVRLKANLIVDTTALSVQRLREHLIDLVLEERNRSLIVNVLTFGFKHGAPQESDLLFDVRFLPNPYYDEQLRVKTGLDLDVCDYVHKTTVASEFMVKLTDMIDFLIPQYIAEGKSSLVIAIACTGGKHRSVCIGEELYKHIQKTGLNVVINHRDKDKM